MKRLPRTLAALAGALAVVLAGACTGNDDEPEDNQDAAPDQVTYVTNFGNFGRDGYAYCADENGYFGENNIEVEIQPGSGTEDNLALLLGGQADFTTIDAAGAVIAQGDGTAGFKAVAAIQQNNLSTIMTIDPEIVSPQDLEGRIFGTIAGGVVELLFPTYAELAGFNPDEVEIQPLEPQDLPAALASGQVDAIGQFAVGVGFVQAAAEGAEVRVFPYTDYITDLYGVVLVTTDEMIEQNPDLVRRFADGLLQGLEFSLDSPDECGAIVAEREQAQPPEVAAGEMAAMEPYARVGSTPLGALDSQRVAQMIATLEAAGAVPAGLTPEQLVAFDLVPAG